jgi:hypothetical protein
MPELVEVEVFTLGELKALGHKGFQGAIERMRQWNYMDADEFTTRFIEDTFDDIFGKDNVSLLAWSTYPPSISVKGRGRISEIRWDHPMLKELQLDNLTGEVSFTVRDIFSRGSVGCRASWDYPDGVVERMSDDVLLMSSELLESWFTALMEKILGEAIDTHEHMMSDEELTKHADDVGIQWLSDGRPLY